MYKWHVHAAIGRGRPVTSDLLRAADGIAASLRQFSVSVSRAADDEPSYPRISRTRTERTRDAVNEVSSLSPPRTGVDARLLAAKPPQGFTISRVPGSGGSEFPDRTFGGANFRGGTNSLRGRGPRGRGRGAARGRGKGTKKSKGTQRGPREQDEEDEIEEEPEYTEEEKKYQDLIHGGFPTPYEPTTTLEDLVTPTLASPRGLVESVKYKMQVATSNTGGAHKIGGEHLARMARGDGTFFESTEAKSIVEKFNNQIREEQAERYGWDYEPIPLPTLPEADREALARAWAAGHYELPKHPELDDVVGHVSSYVRRNETYLPADGEKFEEKLRSLLPAQFQKASPRKTAAKQL